MNVFKEAGKAQTKLTHLRKLRDDRYAQVGFEVATKLDKILRPLDKRVVSALVDQGVIVDFGGGMYALSHREEEEAPEPAPKQESAPAAADGDSVLDGFAKAACGGPAALRLFDAATSAPDLVPRAQ